MTPFAHYCLLLADLYQKHAKDRRERAKIYGDKPTRPRTGYTRLTKDQKLAIVAAYKASGRGIEAIAKEYGISAYALRHWLQGKGLEKRWADEA
jgi:transposase-like protein